MHMIPTTPLPKSRMIDVAMAYADKGIPVFPCHSEMGPDCKKPLIVGWQSRASTATSLIQSWWQQWPDAMIGCPTGKRSGFVVLDVDGEEGRQPLALLEAINDELPRTMTVRTASGGLHYLFKCPENVAITNNAGKIGEGLDVRGCKANGSPTGYVIMAGSVRGDGAAYTVEHEGEFAELPDWLLDRMSRKSAPAVLMAPPESEKQSREYMAKNGRAPDHHPFAMSELRRHCDNVANAKPRTRNDTLNKGAYQLAHFVPHHFPASEVYDSLMVAATQCGLMADDGEDKTAATIRSGLRSGYDVAPVFYQGTIEPVTDLPPFPGTPEANAAEKTGSADKLARHYPLTCPRPKRSWLVEHIIPQGPCVGLCVGASGSGKTFVVIELARCLALGVPFLGKKVVQAGSLLNASESAYGVPDRYKAAFSVNPELDPSTVACLCNDTAPPDLSTDEGKKEYILTLKALSADCEKKTGQPLRLVILDTFSASFSVKDENSNAEIAGVVRICYEIAHAMNCAVMVVHHFGKNKERGARGGSAFRSNVDFQIDVKPGQVWVEKVKDAPVQYTLSQFALRPVGVGLDNKGNPITSMRVEAVAAIDEGVPDVGGRPAEGDRELEELLAANGGKDVLKHVLRNEFYTLCEEGLPRSAKYSRFERALKRAVGRGECSEHKGMVKIPKIEAPAG
jgi:hypothetical protein